MFQCKNQELSDYNPYKLLTDWLKYVQKYFAAIFRIPRGTTTAVVLGKKV